MYSVHGYGEMIKDYLRMDVYAQTLHRVIRPGCVVVDLGTGPGIFALLACRYGAGRVYAVEPADVIQMAREIARANHVEDRITFFQDVSTKAQLPEKADVIISDMRGVLPLFEHHVPAIADARRRLLAKGGALIPRCDTLWAAIVEEPELYQDHYSTPWEHNRYDLDMSAARHKVINTWRKARIKPQEFLTEARCWATLDYTTIENPDTHANITWTVERTGTAHGLAAWFDTELAEGIGFSNAPGQPELIYGNAFFPLSQPVPVAAGDQITVALRADLVGDDYVWSWNTTVSDPDHPDRPRARFAQSTFYGDLFSPARMRQLANSHLPSLSEDGKVDRFILGQMTGTSSLGAIACQLAEEFPGRFPTVKDALTRVGILSERYGGR